VVTTIGSTLEVGMRTLYPEIDPYESALLPVSQLHKIYYERCGRPSGQPALFLHGGPGSNTSPVHRRFFNPDHYDIVLFDQRGCGKSTPSACTIDNTTAHLIADIERLREHLGIQKWLVFGGSWGSALALAYAQAHPDKVTGLILRGIFFVTKRELRWFYQDGASRIFPDEFEQYIEIVPESQRHDLIGAYDNLLRHPDPEIQLRAARAWCRWEAAASFLIPRDSYARKFEDDRLALAFAKIECHYFMRGAFFASESELLDNIPRIRAIKARILQGRYDLVCPFETAWALHRAWPEAQFRVIPGAGHSALDDQMTSALVEATDEFCHAA
jgi:proline iminopeptidase